MNDNHKPFTVTVVLSTENNVATRNNENKKII